MNTAVKNIFLLTSVWLLTGCGQSKPSQEILAAIDYIEKTSLMPRPPHFSVGSSISVTDTSLKKSNYLRFYSHQDSPKGRKIKAVYVSQSLAGSVGYYTMFDKFKLKNHDNVYYVPTEYLPTHRNSECNIITQHYNLDTKELDQYIQQDFWTNKEVIVHGVCNSRHYS